MACEWRGVDVSSAMLSMIQFTFSSIVCIFLFLTLSFVCPSSFSSSLSLHPRWFMRNWSCKTDGACACLLAFDASHNPVGIRIPPAHQQFKCKDDFRWRPQYSVLTFAFINLFPPFYFNFLNFSLSPLLIPFGTLIIIIECIWEATGNVPSVPLSILLGFIKSWEL